MSTPLRRSLVAASLASVALAAAPQAHATSFGSWGATRPTMNVNPWMIFASPSYYAMVNTVNYLYNNPSTFYWTLAWDDDTTYAVYNGENETTNTTDAALLGGSSGRCIWNISGTTILEADVYMDTNTSWEYDHDTTQSAWFGGTKRPYETTFLHEMGHAAGLSHVNTAYNVMGQDYTHVNVNGTTYKPQLGGDAASVLRTAYGDWATNDLGVYAWKYNFASGEYSWHTRTVVKSSTGATFSSYTSGPDTVYQVPKGSTVSVEFTYDNQGTSAGSRLYSYYLSTDRSITTSDTLLTTAYRSIGMGVPTTASQTVTIPTRISTGTYYVGVIADSGNGLTETDEANNAAYDAIYVY